MARVPKTASRKIFLAGGMYYGQFLFIFLVRPASLYCEEYVHIYTYVYRLYNKCRCYQITLRVKHFYTHRERCEVLTGCYHWDAGLAVTGRICGIEQNVLQSSFQTGSSSDHSYCHICFLIASPEEDFIRNIIIILYINYIIIICINNNNTLNNNYYWRLQDLTELFKIPLSTRKDLFEIHGQFGQASSERFASPNLRFFFRWIICPLHALAINSQMWRVCVISIRLRLP